MKISDRYQQLVLGRKTMAITAMLAIIGLVGCQEKGPAEKAGQSIDSAGKSAEKKLEQVTESAGRTLEKSKESVAEKTVATGDYIDDSVITAKIKAAILNEPGLKTSQIEVSTANGIVTLAGAVDSQVSIDRAIALAIGQKGVKSVNSKLTILAPKTGNQ